MMPVGVKLKLDLWMEVHDICSEKTSNESWSLVEDMRETVLGHRWSFLMRLSEINPELMYTSNVDEMTLIHLVWRSKI